MVNSIVETHLQQELDSLRLKMLEIAGLRRQGPGQGRYSAFRA